MRTYAHESGISALNITPKGAASNTFSKWILNFSRRYVVVPVVDADRNSAKEKTLPRILLHGLISIRMLQ